MVRIIEGIPALARSFAISASKKATLLLSVDQVFSQELGVRGATGTSGSSGNRNLNNLGKKIIGLHAISGYIDNLHEEFEGKGISGHFMVAKSSAHILFGSGADRSFISTSFLYKSSISLEPRKLKLQILLPDGSPFLCDRVFLNFPLKISNQHLPAYLIVFELGTYDIILGMDWLGRHHAEILCKEKIVRVKTLEGEFLIRKNSKFPIHTISAVQAINMIKQGDEGYLCFISSSEEKTKLSLKEILIVCKYPNVFPEDLLGLPPR